MNKGNSALDDKLTRIMGEKLKALRMYKGYSLQYVADRILSSKNRGTISHWEAGRAQPNLTQLKMICTIYDVNVLDFLNEVYKEVF